MNGAAMHAAAALCVAAAAVHLWRAREGSSRVGHAVMLAAMVALGLGMDQVPVVAGCLVALAATAGRLVVSDHGGSRACALDAVACAALVGLAWLSMPTGHDAMAGMTGMPGMEHPASLSWTVLGTAALAGVAWAGLGRLVDRSRTWAAQGASAVMIGGMAVMALH